MVIPQVPQALPRGCVSELENDWSEGEEIGIGNSEAGSQDPQMVLQQQILSLEGASQLESSGCSLWSATSGCSNARFAALEVGSLVLSAAWTNVIYELDDLRRPGEFHTRTTIAELRAAQGRMQPFEYGQRAGVICTLQCPPERRHLAFQIVEIEATSEQVGDVPCTVADETGSMEATITEVMLNEHGPRIKRGTCMVLDDPCFFPLAAWSHHLIIHQRSLVLLRADSDLPPSAPASQLSAQSSSLSEAQSMGNTGGTTSTSLGKRKAPSP